MSRGFSLTAQSSHEFFSEPGMDCCHFPNRITDGAGVSNHVAQ